MSRPVEASAARVKRRASVPCGSIPSGNCFSVRLAIFSANCGCIILPVRFSNSSGSEIPSIMSSGSITLPLDLDIFCPSSSRIRPVTYTVLNGTCGLPFSSFTKCMVSMIMRAIQKKMMSKPLVNTLVGWNVFSASVCSGQPSVEKVHRPEENHVSRTSSSCFSSTSALRLFSRRTSSSSRPTNTLPSLSYHAGMR